MGCRQGSNSSVHARLPRNRRLAIQRAIHHRKLNHASRFLTVDVPRGPVHGRPHVLDRREQLQLKVSLAPGAAGADEAGTMTSVNAASLLPTLGLIFVPAQLT